MNTAQDIKASINLRAFVQHDLGKPHTSAANYDMYRCPIHHETKGYSLAVYADHWTCYGKCNETGDVFKWLERYQGLNFKEALAYLGGAAQNRSAPTPARQRAAQNESPSNPPSDEWQFNAGIVVETAVKTLWSEQGKPAMDYLWVRGLLPDTIADARLGYLPGAYNQWVHPIPGWKKPDGKPVSVPCGVVIPHFADNNLWAVRVRRAAGEIKYQGIPGGSKCLYWSDWILPGLPILITEGEFDCLLAHQSGLAWLCVVSLASASNKHINRRWWSRLVAAPQIFIRTDEDDAGKRAAAQLSQLSSAVRIVQVPETKDITDFYLKYGHTELREWIRGMVR